MYMYVEIFLTYARTALLDSDGANHADHNDGSKSIFSHFDFFDIMSEYCLTLVKLGLKFVKIC